MYLASTPDTQERLPGLSHPHRPCFERRASGFLQGASTRASGQDARRSNSEPVCLPSPLRKTQEKSMGPLQPCKHLGVLVSATSQLKELELAYKLLLADLRPKKSSDSEQPSFDFNSYAGEIEPRSFIKTLCECIARDISSGKDETLRVSAISVLGVVFFKTEFYTLLSSNAVNLLLSHISKMLSETQEKKTIFSCLWLVRLMKIPFYVLKSQRCYALLLNSVSAVLSLPSLNETLLVATFFALRNLIRLSPSDAMSPVGRWLLPSFLLLLSECSSLQGVAIDFIHSELGVIASDLDAVSNLLLPQFQARKANILKAFKYSCEESLRKSAQLWAIIMVLLSRHIISSTSFLPRMLEIGHEYFIESENPSAKRRGFCLWIYLAYALAVNRRLADETMLRVIIDPVLRALRSDTPQRIRLAAVKLWMTTCYALVVMGSRESQELTTFYHILGEVFNYVLFDEDPTIRNHGEVMLWVLLGAHRRTTQQIRIKNPIAILESSMSPLDYIAEACPNMAWVRPNFRALSKLCINVFENDSEKSYNPSDPATVMPERPKKLLLALINALKTSFSKDISLGIERATAVIEFGELIGDLAHSKCLAQQLDFLSELIGQFLIVVPQRHVSDMRCRHFELEQMCVVRMQGSAVSDAYQVEPCVTSICHLIRLWIEVLGSLGDHQEPSTHYWSQYQKLVSIAATQTNGLLNMYTLVYLLEAHTPNRSSPLTMEYWSYIAVCTREILDAYNRDSEILGDGDPLTEPSEALVLPILMWPLWCVGDVLDVETPVPAVWEPLFKSATDFFRSRQLRQTSVYLSPQPHVNSVIFLICPHLLAILADAERLACAQNLTKLSLMAVIALVISNFTPTPGMSKGRRSEDFLTLVEVFLRFAVLVGDGAIRRSCVNVAFSAVSQLLTSLIEKDSLMLAYEIIKASASALSWFIKSRSESGKSVRHELARTIIKVWTFFSSMFASEITVTVVEDFGTVLRSKNCPNDVVQNFLTLWNEILSVHAPDDTVLETDREDEDYQESASETLSIGGENAKDCHDEDSEDEDELQSTIDKQNENQAGDDLQDFNEQNRRTPELGDENSCAKMRAKNTKTKRQTTRAVKPISSASTSSRAKKPANITRPSSKTEKKSLGYQESQSEIEAADLDNELPQTCRIVKADLEVPANHTNSSSLKMRRSSSAANLQLKSKRRGKSARGRESREQSPPRIATKRHCTRSSPLPNESPRLDSQAETAGEEECSDHDCKFLDVAREVSPNYRLLTKDEVVELTPNKLKRYYRELSQALNQLDFLSPTD